MMETLLICSSLTIQLHKFVVNYSFFFSVFILLKKYLGLMDHLLVLRNPNLPKVKTNGIFNTDLLLFQYWLLELVWNGSIHYVTKAENFK